MEMFMTKQNVFLWAAVLWIGTLTGQVALTQQISTGGDTNQANVVLQPNDIKNAKVDRIMRRNWITAVGSEGKPHGQAGVVQEIEVQEVMVRIHYCEFGSNEEAHNAAEFHIKDVASIFQTGMWSNATHKIIGDESWFTEDESVDALLIRSGRVCILLSCREGDREKRRSVAEMVGERIITNVADGKRVIVPQSDHETK